MKRMAALLLAGLLLVSGALAADDDAIGLYTPLDEAQETELAEAAERILDEILLDDMTDGEKALALHDWLVTHCGYSVTLYRDMAYGALVQGAAICRGYAHGYEYLAQAAGLDSVYTFSVPLLHAWTLTELDGSYYCIDPTWDDNHYERIGFVSHRHCMFSTANEQATSHYGEDTALIAGGGIYETAPWRDAVTQVIFDDDYMYFITRALDLVRCDRESWECETLYTIADSWPGFYEDYDTTLPAPATGLEKIGGRLWFNTPYTILSIRPNGKDVRTALETDGAEGFICGIAQRDGKLVWSVSKTVKTLQYDLCGGSVRGRRLTVDSE